MSDAVGTPSEYSPGEDSQLLLLERVYQEIKCRIVYGRYKPGMALSESVLARVNHSSRTPVREALSRLMEEGYVERSGKRGYEVAAVTLAGIRQTFEVRRVLEVMAAGLAAERSDLASVARMRTLADYPTLEQNAESYRARLTVNDRFHIAVAQGADNGLLVDLVRRCVLQHDRVLSLSDRFPVLRSSVPQHHAIVDAIERRDADGARQAMREHLDASNALVMDWLIEGRIRGISI